MKGYHYCRKHLLRPVSIHTRPTGQMKGIGVAVILDVALVSIHTRPTGRMRDACVTVQLWGGDVSIHTRLSGRMKVPVAAITTGPVVFQSTPDLLVG